MFLAFIATTLHKIIIIIGPMTLYAPDVLRWLQTCVSHPGDSFEDGFTSLRLFGEQLCTVDTTNTTASHCCAFMRLPSKPWVEASAYSKIKMGEVDGLSRTAQEVRIQVRFSVLILVTSPTVSQRLSSGRRHSS